MDFQLTCYFTLPVSLCEISSLKKPSMRGHFLAKIAVTSVRDFILRLHGDSCC